VHSQAQLDALREDALQRLGRCRRRLPPVNPHPMYLTHFGLNAAPFALTPDTAFASRRGAQREALDTLVLAVDGGEGFIKITGEVGTGKTLLCPLSWPTPPASPQKHAIRRRACPAVRASSAEAGYPHRLCTQPCLSPRHCCWRSRAS